jgi:hypothetical protein
MNPDYKAKQMLLRYLSPEQRQTFQTRYYFDVKGNVTGRVYRIICSERFGNVYSLDSKDTCHKRYCFGLRSSSSFPAADTYLMQAMLIRCNEKRMLWIVHREITRIVIVIALVMAGIIYGCIYVGTHL